MGKDDLPKYFEFLLRYYRLVDSFWILQVEGAITCRPYGTSPSGTTGNSPAIYCRGVGTMFVFI